MRISNYPVAADKSEGVQAWLKEQNIQSELYHFASKDDKWYELGMEKNPHASENAEQEKAEERYQKCLFRNCLTLENGVLGRCSRSIIAEQVQGFSAKAGDYLPVADTLDFSEKLEEYIHTPSHMEACCHCKGTDGDNLIEAALQLK